MDRKQLFLLSGILIVLLGVVLVTGVMDRDSSTIRIPTLAISADEADLLTIVTPTDSLVLRKTGMQWMLSHPVEALSDSMTVARLLQNLKEVRLETVASTNPGRYTHYGVDTASARVVTVAWGDQKEQLMVGRQGPDFQSFFVRVGDDPRVFTTRGSLTVPEDLDRWRDKKVLDVAMSSIASVTVQRPEGGFEVTQTSSGWQLDGAPTDSLSVANWLRRFGPMRADGFFDDLAPDILQNASYGIALQKTDGTTEIIRMAEYDDALALTNTGGATTFRLLKSRLSSYFPEAESLQ